MKDKKITNNGSAVPSVNEINVPKQKTLVGETADELDERANEWLSVRAKKNEPPPMLGKAGACNGNYFVVYYWFEKQTA